MIFLDPSTEYEETTEEPGFKNKYPGTITLTNANVTTDTYVINDFFQGTYDPFDKGENTFCHSGYTITVTGGKYTATNKNHLAEAIFSVSGESITFEDVDITGKNNNCIYVYNNSVATIKGENTKLTMPETVPEGQGYSWGVNVLSVASGGTINVEAGNFTTSGYGGYIYSSGGTINIKGGTWTQNEGNASPLLQVDFDSSEYSKFYSEDETPSNVAVTGGEFNLKGSGAFLGGSALNSDNGKVAVTGGTFDDKNKIPAGYGYKEINGKYQIVPVAQIGGNKYYTLAEAFEAANKISEPTVKLLADVNLDTAIEINKTTGIYLHFNFDGHTINSSAENTFIVKKGRFWIQNTNATAGGITQTASGAVIKVVSDGTNEASFKMRESTGSYTIANTDDDNTDYVIDISGGSKA